MAGAYSLLCGFFLFVAAAAFLPNVRLWGVNHLAFYPLAVRLAAFILIGASFLPRVGRAVFRRLDAVPQALTTRRRVVLAVVLSLVSLAAFVAFSSATQLLGDGLYTTNNIERGAKVDREVFAEVMKNPYPVYPGTEMLNLGLSRFASKVLHVPPLAAVKVLNACLGALLVFLVVIAYRPSPSHSPATQTAFVALALLAGGIQMFFGYIEAYTPLIFFTGLYGLTACRTLTQGAGLKGPAACALTAFVMHTLGLLLIPSLLFLVLWEKSGRKTTRRLLVQILVLAVAVIAVPWVLVQTTGAKRFVLSHAPAGGSYAVWSIAHLVDIANEMLLVFPAIVVLGGAAIVAAIRVLRSRSAGGDLFTVLGSREFLSSPSFPEFAFAAFLFVPSLLFALFFKPELGMARDWDLFTIAAVGPVALVFAVLGRLQSSGDARKMTEIILPPALVMTAVLTAAWVGINAHPARSVARFESILSYDHTRAEYAYEGLAAYYQDEKDVTGEIRAWEKAIEVSPNPRYLYALGVGYYHVGEKEKAISALERCLRMRPTHDRARQSLAQMLYVMKRYDEVLAVCQEGARISPREGFYPFLMGETYVELGLLADALDAFDACRALNPPPEVAAEIDKLLRSVPPEALEERRVKKEQEKTR